LEQAGYLLGWPKVVAGKQRRYYEATPEGKKALAAAKGKLQELATEVFEGKPATHQPTTVLRAADLAMDLVERRVTRGGIEIPVTQQEFELLNYLLRHKNTTLTRQRLQQDVWKEPASSPMSNTVSVFVGSLRRKIEKPGRPKLIHTIKKVGYCLQG
jgi:DNA-binding response OmpR family regulator